MRVSFSLDMVFHIPENRGLKLTVVGETGPESVTSVSLFLL